MNIIAQAASGSINLLRLSGPLALEIASTLLSANIATKLANNPRTALLARLSRQDEFIDSALVIYFKSPASFTGEDIVEFHIHGGYLIAERVINALIKAGARPAKPGEFSKRACLNGKMSLEKALLLNELINAKSEAARKVISKNIDEPFKELITSTQDAITLLLAYIETAIDYADDDLPLDLSQQIFDKLKQNAASLKQIATRSANKRALVEGFALALIGEPNVGKSSLLNALLDSERAIVSPIAGTTRDSVEEQLNMDGFLLRLIDTAGIREQAGDEIERIGIKRSLASIERADVLIFISDASAALSEQSRSLLARCEQSGKKLIIALNKSDLGCKNELSNRKDAVKISAANKQITELKSALLEHFKSFNDEEFILSNAALIAAFNDAANALEQALLHAGELELASYFLQQARKILAIFGKELKEGEVLDAMFSSFCLGK